MYQRILSRLIGLILAVSLLLPVMGVSADVGGPTPYLLRDINDATSKGSEPRWLMPAGDVTFFFLTNDAGETGLWKTNGTPEGTVLVRENLAPGSSNDDYGRVPDEGQFIVYQGILYFAGSSLDEETVLWRTDGTEAGTYALLDKTGSLIPDPRYMIVQDNHLYFIADWNRRFFTSDGTPEGTSGGGATRIWSKFTAFQGNLYYFYSYFDTNKFELDAIELTFPAFSLPPDLHTNSSHITVINDRMCFTAQEYPAESGHGWELWCMDALGDVTMVKDINMNGDSNPSSHYVYDGFLIFSADDGNGRKLWRTDGSEAGTMVVHDPGLGPEDFYTYQYLGVAGAGAGQPSKLIFTMYSYGSPYNVWSTDGSPQGTVQIGMAAGYEHTFAGVLGNWLYYTGSDDQHGAEVWRTDGSVQGTALFKDVWPGERESIPWSLVRCAEKLCFAADDGQHGSELWSTDGSLAGTKMVVDMNSAPPDSSPWDMTKAEGQVFFIASDQVSATNLWRTDGTQAGTLALNHDPSVDFVGLTDLYQPGLLLAVGSNVYFTASEPAHGQELWRSDGTPAGTKMVKDIYPGSTGSTPYRLVKVGNQVYFLANNPESGRELWVSDGSEAGTHLVKDMIPNNDSSFFGQKFVAMEERLVFTIYDYNEQLYRLWVSDGSEAGTKMIASFMQARYLVEAGGLVFFAGSETSDNPEYIYVTDGSANGTKPISTTDVLWYVSAMYSAGDRIFIIDNEGYYYFLYSFDVNPGGIGEIHLLQDKYSMGKSNAPGCVVFEGKLGCAVQATDGYTSPMGEVYLWVSDGTYNGTRQITGNFSWPTQLLGKGPALAFIADTPGEGRQIWETDGTLEGTQQISHISQTLCGPATLSYWPYSLAYLGGQYLLALDDSGSNPAHGCELWALDLVPPRAFLPVITR